MDSIFSYKGYKPYLKNLTKNQRGLLSKLAKAAGCEISYLSRTLSHEIHITADHAYKISNEIGHTTLERDYFLLLVEYDRAGDPSYRSFLKSRLEKMKKDNEDLSQKSRYTMTPVDQYEFLYHSHWAFCAIHILVSIPEFQTVTKIAHKLYLNEQQVLYYLNQLAEMGYVKKSGQHQWQFLSGDTHTSKNSPLVTLHHSNWRNKGVQDSQNFNSDSVHYTSVHSLSHADFEKIKQIFLKAIGETEKLAAPSDCETLINLNVDCYKV